MLTARRNCLSTFLTKQGRVETTNYRTVRLPEAQEIPLYVKDKFGDFYRDLFTQQVKRESERGVFMEYAWDMNWCDPCAANPLSADELRGLGVFWQDGHGTDGQGHTDGAERVPHPAARALRCRALSLKT
jgi:hypothetical protein